MRHNHSTPRGILQLFMAVKLINPRTEGWISDFIVRIGERLLTVQCSVRDRKRDDLTQRQKEEATSRQNHFVELLCRTLY